MIMMVEATGFDTAGYNIQKKGRFDLFSILV